MNKSITLLSLLIPIILFAGCVDQPKNVSEDKQANIEQELTTTSGEEGKYREITVDAKRWEFTPSEIRVKQGEKIKIKINNTDTIHGITIPEMSISEDDEVLLDTSQTGEFEFFCASFCGGGHGDMKGKIIIE